MKKIKSLIFLLIIFLIFFNIYFFYLSIKLGNEISYYEEKTEKIYHENVNLEKELSSIDSLEYAKKIASYLEFDKNPEVYFLDSLKNVFAFKE